MYSLMLIIHSWLRWAVVISMFVLLIQSIKGWRVGGEYQKSDKIIRIVTVSIFDIQFLLGVYLYFFLSPIVKVAFEPGVQMMEDSQLRFFAMEHFFAMVIALIVMHGGAWFAKKAQTVTQIHKRITLTIATTFLIILASIPWPFLPYGRILFRFG